MSLNWRARLQKALTRRSEDRGLMADEPDETDAAPGANHQLEPREIAVASVAANPHQPRATVDDEGLRDLAESIAQHGVLQPILVRQIAEGYELVAGQRRLRAAQMIGLERIPAMVVAASDEDSGLLALVENLQREGLSFMEEAAAYERLTREFHLTQEELARRLGKSQSTIANKLRLLRLPEAVRQRVQSPAFTERHARALLSLKEEANQLRAIAAVENKALTVRQTEALVERLVAEETAGGAHIKRRLAQSWRGVFRDARILSNTFKAAVDRLREAGMQADLEETELDEGLEIRVLVHLPAGWRDPSSGPRRGGAGRRRGGSGE